MKESTLAITQTFDCAIETMWDAWTNPTTLAKWYGPEGIRADIHAMEVKEGGSYALTMKSEKGDEYPLKGKFVTLNKPNLLVMTWQWQDGKNSQLGAETMVTVSLRDMGKKTELTLTHELTDAESMKHHDSGWRSSFVKLKTFAEKA